MEYTTTITSTTTTTKLMIMILIVCHIYAPRAHGQSHLIALENGLIRQQLPLNLTSATNSTTESSPSDNHTTLTVFNNTPKDTPPTSSSSPSPTPSSSELSQTAMDVITIVWYVATFLALAAFFMLMACSDRRCRHMRSHPSATPNERMRAPPTPSPSYSEFAPPSYDTVIKMQHAAKTSIFVIPFDGGLKANEITPAPPTPALYTVNEVHKTTH